MTQDHEEDKQRRQIFGRGLARPLLVTLLVAAVAGVVAAVVLTADGDTAAGSAGPADPRTQESVGPTGTSQSPPEVVAHSQESLLAEADRIRALVREGDLEGFAGLRISLETSRVTVYLKGEKPAELISLLSESTVPVDVVDAPYTRDELAAERARILADPASVLGVTEI
nr:hypothetical protein [Micromonospora sp. DSM 115978]